MCHPAYRRALQTRNAGCQPSWYDNHVYPLETRKSPGSVVPYLPDGVVKWATGKYIEHIVPTNTVSGELLHRCIDGNTKLFTRQDLDKIDPTLTEALRQWTATQAPKVPGTSKYMPLNGTDEVRDLDGGAKDPRNDIGRAFGHVTVANNKDGSYSVSDSFDFRNHVDIPDNPKTLLEFAMLTSNATNRNVALGRMFCPRGEHGTHPSTSVPYKIDFSAEEIAKPSVPLNPVKSDKDKER